MGNYCCAERDKITQLDEIVSLFQLNDFRGIQQYSILKDYKFVKPLGFCQYGETRLGESKVDKDLQVQIKKLLIKETDKEELKNIFDLVNKLKQCEHPHILQTYECYKEQKNVYIVEEYQENSESISHLFQTRGYTENQRAIIIDQILKGLNYLHSNNMIHRDIRAENIIYKKQDPVNWSNLNLKITNFGLINSAIQANELVDYQGTPYYQAPEIIRQEPYSAKCDIWSLGVLLYFLISGKFPFTGKSTFQLKQNILEGIVEFKSEDRWDIISDNCKDFIRRCLVVNPDERYSASQLFNHKWLANLREVPTTQKSSSPRRRTIIKHAKYIELNDSLLHHIKNTRINQLFQNTIISYLNTLANYKEELNSIESVFKKVDFELNGELSIYKINTILYKFFSKEEVKSFEQIIKDIQNLYMIEYEILIQKIMQKKMDQFQQFLLSNLEQNYLVHKNTRGSYVIDTTLIKGAFKIGGNLKTNQFWLNFKQQCILQERGSDILFDEFCMIIQKLFR